MTCGGVTLLLLASAVGQIADPVRILVPAYYTVSPGNPNDGLRHWDGLIAAHRPKKSEIIAIVNVGAGFTNPGDKAVNGGPFIPTGWNANVTIDRYRTVLGSASTVGVGLVGYVSTRGGQRPIADAKRDIEEWAKWKGVKRGILTGGMLTGVFLDEQAVGTPQDPAGAIKALGYYKELRAHALKVFTNVRKRRGIGDTDLAKPLVVTNPGNVGSTPADLETYVTDKPKRAVADIMVIREDDGALLPKFQPPAFMKNFKENRFATLLHDVPNPKYADYINIAVKQKGIRNVYMTSDNAWGLLPAYWKAEVAVVRKLN